MVARRTKSGRTKVKSIEFTDIKSNSTCLTINLPRDLCCDICRQKKDAACCLLKKSSVGSKRFRDYKSKRWRCQQPWSKEHINELSTGATVRKYVRIANFIGIEPDLLLSYQCAYKKENITRKKNLVQEPSDPPSEHPIHAPTPPAPVPDLPTTTPASPNMTYPVETSTRDPSSKINYVPITGTSMKEKFSVEIPGTHELIYKPKR